MRINLATSLFQQACYKSAAGLLQVVRFCVCTSCYWKQAQPVTTWWTTGHLVLWGASLLNKLFQQVCSNAVILSSCTKFVTHNLLTSCWLQPDNKLLEQTCNKAVEFIKLVASLLQACSNLSTSLGQVSASTSCQQVVATTCYKSAAGLLQVVRFCVCTRNAKQWTTCQQVVLATSLITCCQQVCDNAVIFVKLYQVCYSQLVDKLLTCSPITSCWNKLVTRLLSSSSL